jgi:hypothetical protein
MDSAVGARPKGTIVRRSGPQCAQRVRAFALVELGDSESIDLFLREQDARRALDEILSDEPNWAGLFYVQAVELDERLRSEI